MLLASDISTYIPIETRPIPEKKVWGWIESIYFIYRKRSQISHVIIDLYGYKWFYFACLSGLACRLLNLKYIIIPHSYVLKIKWEKHSKLLFSLLSKSEVVVSPSSFFTNLFKHEKIKSVIIPNPVADHLFPRFPFLPIKTPRLLWVRNVNPKYQPELAIKVLAVLHQKYPHAILTLVGEFKNSYQQDLISLAESLGVSKQLFFTGRLANNSWSELARTHNIFINTSPIDNAPLSLIEAALTGLPIVSTKAGGIPFLFKEKKEILLSPVNNPEAMAANIEHLINYHLFANNMTDNAFEKASQSRLNHVSKLWVDLLLNNKLPQSA